MWSCGRLRASYSSLINVYNTYSAKTTCIIKALRESGAIWGHLKSLIHVLYWEATTCRRSSRRLLGFHAFCITAAAVRGATDAEFHYPKDQANCCPRLLGECFKSVHACRVNLGQTSGGFPCFPLGHCDRLLPVLALCGKVGLCCKSWTISKRHLPAAQRTPSGIFSEQCSLTLDLFFINFRETLQPNNTRLIFHVRSNTYVRLTSFTT